ncbi:MAG: hypothetical protein ACREV2_02525, partial [Burkholderiales bacterium]
TIRLASGALALFAYAAPFSFAYITLETGVGALLLFGAVQSTMILTGHGERLALQQSVGLALALSGLVHLMLRGLAAPPTFGLDLDARCRNCLGSVVAAGAPPIGSPIPRATSRASRLSPSA